MLTVIGGKDRTNVVNRQALSIATTLTDKIPEISVVVTDIGSTSPLSIGQDIIIIDETTTTSPTHNILLNPLLTSPTVNGQFPPQPPNPGDPGGYASTARLGAIGVSVTDGPPEVFTVSSAGVAYYQLTQPGYCVAGQKYCFSVYGKVTATLTNCVGFVQLDFCDQAGNRLSPLSSTQTTFSTASSRTRFNVQATAPTNAYYAIVYFGISIVSGGDSGTIQFDTLQLEPVLFPSLQTYPTPDCNATVSGCKLLPDGTCVRQNRLFAGMVSHIEPHYDGTTTTYTLTCRGSAFVLETTNYSGVFSAIADGNILTSVVAAVASNLLDTSNVLQIATIDARTYDDISLMELVTDLANNAACIFYVSWYYELYYIPLGYLQAPYALSDSANGTTTFPYHDWQCPKDGTQLKSRVTVHGGPFKRTVTQSFTGNGSTKVFTLADPTQPGVAVKVTDVSSVQVAGVEQTKGVLGNNNTTYALGYAALVDFGHGTVNFNNNIANGTTVTVTFVCDSQIRTQVSEQGSYLKYHRWFDAKIQDTNLTTTTAAYQRGLAEVSQYAYELATPHFKCFVSLAVGQMVNITSSLEAYSSQPFLVQKVTLGYNNSAGMLEYEVECGSDMSAQDLTTAIKHLHKATQRARQLAGGVVSDVRQVVRDNMTMQDNGITITNQPGTVHYDAANAIYGYCSYA